MTAPILWKCPKCNADVSRHGNGGVDKCASNKPMSGFSSACTGFLCECEHDVEDGHGDSHESPCENAFCYHCNWSGTFPVPLFNVAKLKGWAKKAHEAGWKPPEGWTP